MTLQAHKLMFTPNSLIIFDYQKLHIKCKSPAQSRDHVAPDTI